MDMTPLEAKKVKGKARYDRAQARVQAERVSRRRTRNSDISAPRITNGISGKTPKQVFKLARTKHWDFLEQLIGPPVQ